jgi:DNA-binding response OmpR family regulator
MTEGRRVLVVEDDEKSRRLLRDVLVFHGFEVTAVDSGEAGVHAARLARPDAALLDIQLPGIDGLGVLQALREEYPDHRLPVLAVTASVMDTDRKIILAAGFDAYVPKPVHIRELLATLEGLLEDRRA